MSGDRSRGHDHATELRVQLDRERSARLARRELQRLATGSVAARDVDEVAYLVMGACSHLLDTGPSSLAFRDGDGIRLVHTADVPVEVAARWSTVPADTPLPVVRALDHDATWNELSDLDDLDRWPAFAAEARRMGLSAHLAIPLRPDPTDAPVAALGLGFRRAEPLRPADRQVLGELVAIAAEAISRAAELQHAQRVSAEFQAASLDDDLPRVDDLTIRTLYAAGDDASHVGGDWFDVVTRPDGSVALVIGDVSGHDVSSAARVSGVRHVLSSQLLERSRAADALAATDRYLHHRGGTYATAAVVVLDAGRARGHVALAGHPPPLRVAAHGVTAYAAAPGPPLGSGLGGYRDAPVRLDPGDAVVAFTDGLVERRDRPIDHGITDLAATLGAVADRRPATLLRVLRRHLADVGPDDDAAVLLTVRTT